MPWSASVPTPFSSPRQVHFDRVRRRRPTWSSPFCVIQGSTITDDDIDAILAKGEEKTKKFSEKLRENVQHSLANFSLDRHVV